MVQFFRFKIFIDKDPIGEMFVPTNSPQLAYQSFLVKTGGFIGAGPRRIVEERKGQLNARLVE
jgi:hypothetical protein